MTGLALARSMRSFAAVAAWSLLWVSWTLPTAYGQAGLDVYTVNADGSDAKRIHHDGNSTFGSPNWSRDGKKIAFDGWTNQTSFQAARIFVLTLGEEKPADLGPGNTPCFSPDDQQIVFFAPKGNRSGLKTGVWVMNADGKGREWISDGTRPRWSPDGDKLVFASRFEGFPSLYIYDMVSLEQTRVLDRGFDDVVGADFSPDGNRLVFVGCKGGSINANSPNGEVAVVDAKAGAKPETVCNGRVGLHPDWSPEGNKLLFRIVNAAGAQELHIFDLDSSQLTPLPNQSGRRNSDASWSPDGKQIVFTSDRGG